MMVTISEPLLFNTFISDIGSGIKRTLSKISDDIRLCGGLDTIERRDVIQRDMDRLEKWTHENLMGF